MLKLITVLLSLTILSISGCGGSSSQSPVGPVEPTVRDKDTINKQLAKIKLVPPETANSFLDHYKASLIKDSSLQPGYGYIYDVDADDEMIAVPVAASEADTGGAAVSNSESSNDSSQAKFDGDYSTTTLQVDGVDEADVAKTDGNYLFIVNQADNSRYNYPESAITDDVEIGV